MIKKIAYKLLDIVTFGKGIKRVFEGNAVVLPASYYRYFPEGYEKDNFLFMNEHIKENMIIFDIGAHIGLMTVAFAKRTGNGGKVYAFEPTPSTGEILRSTIRLNKLTNVSVEPYALADKKGKMTFFISDNEADNSNSLVDNHRLDRHEQKIEVEVKTIDSCVQEKNIAHVDFIKIDAEGAEMRVLKGAEATILKDKPNIILSMHPIGIKNLGDSQAEIWDWIHQHGYKLTVEGKTPSREEFSAIPGMFEAYLHKN